MTVLISEHDRLYRQEESATETKILPQEQQRTLQRCKVEWLSQEDPDLPSASGTGSKTPKAKPEPSTVSDLKLTEPSPIVMSEKSEERQTEGKDKRKKEENVDGEVESKTELSPSKLPKAQPSWKTSFKGGAAPGVPRTKIAGSAGDVSAAGGSNWLMNGLSSFRAHRRTTSSGERLKDSTVSLKDSTLSLKEVTLKDAQRDSDEDSPKMSLPHRALQQSHRMSAYDNVAPSSLSLPSDNSTIWTSVEISLAEPERSGKTENPGKVQKVWDSANTLDHSASGTDDDLTGTNEGLSYMLTELKQELKKQRLSYETCIRK